jgi:hypothetical protein
MSLPHLLRDEGCEHRGVEMKSTLVIATIAFACTVADPRATIVEKPLARHASNLALDPGVGQSPATMWNGRWEGTTVSGHQLVLELQAQGQRLTGRLMVGKQSANITDGKISGDAFTLTTGPIDGHKVDGSGRHTGDAIELTIKGAKKPLTLTRMK